MNKNKINKLNKGYTLLFSVLTAVLVLSVAVFILRVARKQYILSSAAQDSLGSLYNADSGVECLVQAGIGMQGNYVAGDSKQISCNGANPIPVAIFASSNTSLESPPDVYNRNLAIVQAPAPNNPPAYIYVPFKGPTGASRGCALIKIWQGTISDGTVRTIVYSRGYNQCDSNTQKPVNSQRTVERAMQYTTQ